MPAAWALGGAIVAVFAAALGRAILHLRGPLFSIASLVVAEELGDLELGDRFDRWRNGIEPAGPVAGRDRSGAPVLLRHVRRCRGGARDDRAGRPNPPGIWIAVHSAERRRGITCQELVELITEYLEGSLDNDMRARFDQHLAACPGCSDYLEQMRQTIRATGRLREESLEPGATEALLDVFRDWKQGQ